MFELVQLRCFVAVAEERHFRRAAARLNMTQPPLTRRIQMLEHALGVTLLERNTRGVALTPAGEVFLREARRLLHMAEAAALNARRVHRGEAGSLTIGFTAAASYAALPRLVALLRQAAPEVAIGLREAVTAEQLDALQAGRVDLALIRPLAPRRGIRTRRVERERLLVALREAHPLAGGAEVEMSALAGEPLVTYPPVEGRYLHDLVFSLYGLAGVAPGRVQHLSQTHSILGLVAAGMGVAMVPAAAARMRPSGVVLLPLAGPPAVTADLHLAWLEETENLAVPRVLRELERGWAALADSGGQPP